MEDVSANGCFFFVVFVKAINIETDFVDDFQMRNGFVTVIECGRVS